MVITLVVIMIASDCQYSGPSIFLLFIFFLDHTTNF